MDEVMAAPNEEAIRAWNTVLFDKFLRFKALVTTGVSAHSEAALAWHPPRPGARAIDLGCGFGDTTVAIARLAGPDGEALGVDCASRFVEEARRDAALAGVRNARFEVRDVEEQALGGPYDYAFARFGTMFFANPVAALRNVRASMAPRGQFAFIVWRKRDDNPWVYAAQRVVERIVPKPDKGEQATCGPGPFSMADTDVVGAQLQGAGWSRIAFERHDAPICIGRDLDEAVRFALALGPAGEHMRLAGALGEERLPEVMHALRTMFAGHLGPDGVMLPSSAWVVTARA